MDDPYRHIPELDGPIEHVYYRAAADFLSNKAVELGFAALADDANPELNLKAGALTFACKVLRDATK